MSQYIGVLGRPTTCQRGPGDVRLDNKWNPKWKSSCHLGYDIPGYQQRELFGVTTNTGEDGCAGSGCGTVQDPDRNIVQGDYTYVYTGHDAAGNPTYDKEPTAGMGGGGSSGGSGMGGGGSSQMYQHPEQFKVFRSKYDYDQQKPFNPVFDKDPSVQEYYAPSSRCKTGCGANQPHRTLAFDDPYNYNSYYTHNAGHAHGKENFAEDSSMGTMSHVMLRAPGNPPSSYGGGIF